MRFADTSYFLALLSPRDRWHLPALALSRQRQGSLVSTTWVMIELGNAMSDPPSRQVFVAFVNGFIGTARLEIVPATKEWFTRGFELYRRRPDKEWSLTDCISFLVMRDRGVDAALTADRHFAQAGFQVLLQD